MCHLFAMPAEVDFKEEGSMVCRVSAALVVVTLLLMSTPVAAMEEKDARASRQALTIEWLAGIWEDFTSWLAGKAVAPPPGTEAEGSSWVDPNGG